MLLPDYAHRKMTAIYVCICTTYMAECLYLPCNSQCSPWQSGPAPYAFLNSCGKPSRHKLRPGHTYPPTLPYFVPGENSGSGHACTPRGGGGGGNSLLRVCTACMMAYSSWYWGTVALFGKLATMNRPVRFRKRILQAFDSHSFPRLNDYWKCLHIHLQASLSLLLEFFWISYCVMVYCVHAVMLGNFL